jgi:hypothetical protein
LTVLLVPLLGLALLYGIYHVTIWQMVNALTSQLP